VAGVVLDAKFDELREGAGPGSVLEGPLRLGGEALVQLIPLGTVVPIQVAYYPAECRQVRAELQGPHLEVPRSNPGGVGPVRIVVRLAQRDEKFIKGTEVDGARVLAHMVANHIERVALEVTKCVSELGGLRGITMGLRSKLVAQEKNPSTDLIGLRPIKLGYIRVPTSTIDVAVVVATTTSTTSVATGGLGGAHRQRIVELRGGRLEPQLERSGSVAGGIPLDVGHPEFFTSLFQLKLGEGGIGGGGNGGGGRDGGGIRGGRDGRGGRLKDDMGEGFGSAKAVRIVSSVGMASRRSCTFRMVTAQRTRLWVGSGLVGVCSMGSIEAELGVGGWKSVVGGRKSEVE
jgi:hypothetical protein